MPSKCETIDKKKHENFLRNKNKNAEILCNTKPRMWHWILDIFLPDEEKNSSNKKGAPTEEC